MKTFLCSLLLIALPFSFLKSQSELDSLLAVTYETRDTNLFNHYGKIIKILVKTDLNNAKEYVDKQMQLAVDLDNKDLIARAGAMGGMYYAYTSDYTKAKIEFKKVMAIYQELGNTERISATLNNISICNRSLGHLDLALENQMQSLRIKDSIDAGDDAIAASYWNISNILYDIKNIEESTLYLRKAKRLYEKLEDEDAVMSLTGMIAGNLKSNPDSVDVALEMLESCVDYYKKKGYKNDLAGSYESIGLILHNNQKYAAAVDYFLKALVIAEAEGERRFPGILYTHLASSYFEMNKYPKALIYAKKAVEVSKELNFKKKEINDHLVLSKVYRELGDYENAYDTYLTYQTLNDSILSNERVIAMTEMETKYQTEKKEQEIVLLEERAKSSRLKQSLLLLGLIALSIGLLGLWSYFKSKVKRDQLIKDNLDQEIELKTKDLEFKKQELTAFALQLSQKNELLENLKGNIKEIKKDAQDSKSLQTLINTIQLNQTDDTTWDSFKMRFEQVHVGFNKRIKEQYPELTANDLRIISLIKMNLSSKEIANILNISSDGIKKARYRLRKKLNLVNEDSLEHIIITY